ncbi:MAG: AI-2E family transporter [Armatimonadetes bacterium]|nr:AI-2E family transporter [Armatimonadota bacterium]
MITNSWLRITAWAAGLLAAAAVLNIISVLYQPVIRPVLQILLPFSVAVALALLLDPTIDRLERRGLSRGASVAGVSLIFLLVFAAIGILLVPVLVSQAMELADNLPHYYREASKQVSNIVSRYSAVLERFHAPTTLQEFYQRYSGRLQSAASDAIGGAGRMLSGLVSKSIWLVLIPILTIFLLIDIDRLKEKSLLLVPAKHRQRTAALAGSVGRVFGAYIRGLITVAVLYGAACGVAIAAWGVPYSVMLGAASGVLSLVPYIGTISTIVLVGLVALVSRPQSPLDAALVALTIFAINQLFDSVTGPRIVGKAVGVHPVLAIFALLVGGQLFGIVGMVLAVPVAASLQIVILEFCPELRGPKEKPKKDKKKVR